MDQLHNKKTTNRWVTFERTLTHQMGHYCMRINTKHAIFEYIEVFYNRIRIQSANQYLSPVEFETAQQKLRVQSVH